MAMKSHLSIAEYSHSMEYFQSDKYNSNPPSALVFKEALWWYVMDMEKLLYYIQQSS